MGEKLYSAIAGKIRQTFMGRWKGQFSVVPHISQQFNTPVPGLSAAASFSLPALATNFPDRKLPHHVPNQLFWRFWVPLLALLSTCC